MKNFVFLLWLVSYPVASSITRYIANEIEIKNNGKGYSDHVRGMASLIDTCVYIFIAVLLWEG